MIIQQLANRYDNLKKNRNDWNWESYEKNKFLEASVLNIDR